MREDEADSLVRLGKDYLHIRNYDKAMEYLGHAVMLGKTNAAQDLYALGEHFLAEKNYKKAEEAFQMLADRGHGESCLILGEMCEKGLGRQRDYQAAFGFYSESFQQGVDRGAYRAGMLMREDALRVTEVRDIALTWLEEAIKAGIYEAYAAVGDLYSEHFTAGSTPRDDQEAFSWYMKGAMRGDALCLFRVAVCFAEGYGTKPDIPRALRLYRQAADAGSALACRQLGEMYAAGIHVHREIRRALTWYLRAYELGDPEEKRAAAVGMLRVVQAYIDTPRYEEVEELLHSFLEKLHAAGDTSCLFALADIERRRGRMDLYLKDLEMGMQAGHDSCRERWVQYYMNEVVTELRVLEPIFDELAERRGERKFFDDYLAHTRHAVSCCEKAAKAGSPEAWALLAYLYLYHGADIGKRNADFLEAAANGRNARIMDMDLFLWTYFAGPSGEEQGELHHENPLKAFRFAQKMAKKRNEDFYEVLADYYRRGYGTEPNPQMAERYLDKAAKVKEKGKRK